MQTQMGAVATGKIVSYSLKADGSTGEIIGHVEIGCAVGFGNSVSDITGTPEYTPGAGYCQPGYQRYDGGVYALPDNDIGYTAPAYQAFDDGLTFPLDTIPTADGQANGTFSGSTASQAAAIRAAFPVAEELANDAFLAGFTSTVSAGSTSLSSSANAGWPLENATFNLTTQNVPYVMEANPVRWDYYIKSVTNGPFNGAYGLTVTPLEIPQGINLEAESSP